MIELPFRDDPDRDDPDRVTRLSCVGLESVSSLHVPCVMSMGGLRQDDLTAPLTCVHR